MELMPPTLKIFTPDANGCDNDGKVHALYMLTKTHTLFQDTESRIGVYKMVIAHISMVQLLAQK